MAGDAAKQGREALDAVTGGLVEVVLDVAAEVGATEGKRSPSPMVYGLARTVVVGGE